MSEWFEAIQIFLNRPIIMILDAILTVVLWETTVVYLFF